MFSNEWWLSHIEKGTGEQYISSERATSVFVQSASCCVSLGSWTDNRKYNTRQQQWHGITRGREWQKKSERRNQMRREQCARGWIKRLITQTCLYLIWQKSIHRRRVRYRRKGTSMGQKAAARLRQIKYAQISPYKSETWITRLLGWHQHHLELTQWHRAPHESSPSGLEPLLSYPVSHVLSIHISAAVYAKGALLLMMLLCFLINPCCLKWLGYCKDWSKSHSRWRTLPSRLDSRTVIWRHLLVKRYLFTAAQKELPSTRTDKTPTRLLLRSFSCVNQLKKIFKQFCATSCFSYKATFFFSPLNKQTYHLLRERRLDNLCICNLSAPFPKSLPHLLISSTEPWRHLSLNINVKPTTSTSTPNKGFTGLYW